MFDLTPIVEGVIAIVMTAITSFLIPWIKTKYGNETLEKAKNWVHIAVYAAEKIYGAGNGDQKLAYAESFLAEHKIKLDTATLKAMIDAEIKNIVEAAYNTAVNILEENKDKLHFIAGFLFKNEIMDEVQFEAAMTGDPTVEELEAMVEEKRRRSAEENAAKKKRDDEEQARREEEERKAEEERRKQESERARANDGFGFFMGMPQNPDSDKDDDKDDSDDKKE